jgi:ankyrin repeat protein
MTDIGETAFLLASRSGHTHAVVELLKHDQVDVSRPDLYSNSALMSASSEGRSDIVIKLLKDDILNVNLSNNIGDTAFLLACRTGRKHIIAIFEARQARCESSESIWC